MNWYVKQTFLPLITLLLASGCSSFATKDSKTFISPKGSSVSMNFSKSNLSDEAHKKTYLKLGASLYRSKSLCLSKTKKRRANSENNRLKRIETELELSNIVDSLIHSSNKKLTRTQKRVLKKTPICSPFLDELETINLALKGFKPQRITFAQK